MFTQDQLVSSNGRSVALLPAKTITAALTNDTSGYGAAGGVTGLQGAKHLIVQATFTYGSGGTTATAYLQTTLDKGLTWFDIASLQFGLAGGIKVSSLNVATAPAAQAFTPTDGTLAINTVVNGVIGDRVRIKLNTVGVYAGGTTLRVDLLVKG